MNDEDLRNQINELIKDEIQDVINDYVDEKEDQSTSGLGFVRSDEEKQLKAVSYTHLTLPTTPYV